MDKVDNVVLKKPASQYLGVLTMSKATKTVVVAQMNELLKHVVKGKAGEVKAAILEIMRTCHADGFDIGKEEGHEDGYSEGKDGGYHEGYEAKEAESE